MPEWTWRTLQQMAVQESRALREFAKHGRNPTCAPMRWPWEPGYLDLDTPVDDREWEAHCGSPAGYQRHIRSKTVICDDCRTAHSADMQKRRKTRARNVATG